MVVFEVPQHFGFLVAGGQQAEPAADLGGGQRRAHLLDFLGKFAAFGVARLVVLQLGDRRGGLRDLFGVGADLALELRLALGIERFLQLTVLRRRRIGVRRRLVGPLGEFGLAPRDLCVVCGDLHLQRADIGGGKGRVERRQHVASPDPLAFADIQRLDQRRVERLQHACRFRRHDMRRDAADDAIEPRHQ